MKIIRNIDAKKIPLNILKKIGNIIYEKDMNNEEISSIHFHLSVRKLEEEFVILLFNKKNILLEQYTFEIDILDKSISSIDYSPIQEMLNEEDFNILINSIEKYQKKLEIKLKKRNDKTEVSSIFDNF
jgi:hypothetical protein